MTKFAALLFLFITICSDVLAFSEEEKKTKLADIKNLKTSGSYVYALLPKLTDEPFFKKVAEGCADAAKKHGATCIYYGSPVKSVRLQTKDITDLINAGVDGLALSGIRDGLLEQSTKEKIELWELPIVAFDSPINEPVAKVYVGTDNYKMGYSLGKEVRKLRPEGGRYCVQFARADSPNHLQRLNGIIDGLTDNRQDELWSTVFGCPLDFAEDYDRAIRQIVRILKTSKPDVLFSTGSGVQLSETAYRKAMTPYKMKIKSGELIVASIDTLPAQIAFLKEGLSTINIGQRPFEMGTKTFEALWALENDKPVAPTIHTGFNLCVSETVNSCLE